MAEIEKIDCPEDPDRCQGRYTHGQCPNKAEPGLIYCKVHAGGNLVAKKKADLRNFRLSKWKYRDQLVEKAGSSEIKSLTEEIGILRVILEERLLLIDGENNLLLHSGPVADLVMKIKETILASHKLEHSMGHLLDRTSVLTFATNIIQILSKYVKDDALLKIIAAEIGEAMNNTDETEDE